MKVAIYIRRGEYGFYNITEDLLEDFKKKYTNKQWRVVDISDCKNKTEAIKLANQTIKSRIIQGKVLSGRKRSISTNTNTNLRTPAYRESRANRIYYNAIRKNKMEYSIRKNITATLGF